MKKRPAAANVLLTAWLERQTSGRQLPYVYGLYEGSEKEMNLSRHTIFTLKRHFPYSIENIFQIKMEILTAVVNPHIYEKSIRIKVKMVQSTKVRTARDRRKLVARTKKVARKNTNSLSDRGYFYTL